VIKAATFFFFAPNGAGVNFATTVLFLFLRRAVLPILHPAWFGFLLAAALFLAMMLSASPVRHPRRSR